MHPRPSHLAITPMGADPRNPGGVFPALLLLFCLLIGLLALPQPCQANRTITSATLNGASSVTVTPAESINTVVNVTTGGAGNDDWLSTGWRIATTPPGTVNCINHANHLGAGSYSETFNITAPASAGTYNAYFIAYNNDSCSSGDSTAYTRTNGVIVDATPPSVSSINRDNPNPTALATVSWTVTFNESVTGVDAADFVLIQGGGISDAAITGVSGSGATRTVTVSTGSGNGTIGLNLTDNDSIVDAAGNPLGGTGAGNGDYAGQVYTVDRNCFTDNFDGTLAPNWTVGMASGTYTPQIISSRLRLTNTSTQAGTWATLQRIFPGAGNKMTVEFDHYAYGGSGADGIAAIISNAAVAPQAGAFGGSLGYAQKGQYPISDCTTVGGCPGFAGGWLGFGIDEYGNYSTALEGRVGGFPTMVPDSVAIRGSGAGMSGYRYLVGTGSVSPAIDNNGTAIPPHRYRITVDFTDNIHTWVSVERDTSGGGTSYTTLLGCAPGQTSGCTPLDVYDAGYSQDPAPANGYLSFTAASGALTNIHEIDSLKVCSTRDQITPTLHHIRLLHDSQACTGADNPAEITVQACADADCASLYLNSVTVDLSSTGGTWSSDPITFTGGQATVTLTSSTAGTVTLGATATSPVAGNPTRCFDGATESCSLTFGVCAFDVIEPGASADTPIYTKLSGTAFNLDVLSLSGTRQTVDRVEIVDSASSGTCNAYASLADSSTAVPVNFTTTSRRQSFAFNYANAARDARIRVTYHPTTSPGAPPAYACSSDNFAIRPQSLTVTSNATQTGSIGLPVFRAGQDPFSLTATALPGYDGLPKLNAAQVTSDLPNLGLFGTTTFPNATKSTGVSTATGFTYSEVGNFRIGQNGVYDDGFSAVDATKPQPECTSNFNNGPPVSGRYGCMFGANPAGPFGRFVPHHFTVVGTVANGCPAGSFTYMGQPFMLARVLEPTKAEVVEARNTGELVTKNYAGDYAHGAVTFGAENADNGINLSDRLALYSTGTYPPLSGSWTNGVYTLTGNNTSAAFKRPTSTTSDATWGPFESLDLGLTVLDSDVTTLPLVSDADMNPAVAGGTSLTYKKFPGSPLRMRHGLLRLLNAYGPETGPLVMPLRTDYFNGTAFAMNTLDNCTSLALASQIFLSNPATAGGAEQPGTTAMTIGSATTSATMAHVPFLNGSAGLSFSAPGAGNVGYVDVRADISALPWLQYDWDNNGSLDTSLRGRANFGLYRGNDRVINWRETVR